MLGSK
jgi:hypothetical protein